MPKYVGIIADYNIIVYVVCTLFGCFGRATHILVNMKICWYGNHLEEDVKVSVGLQWHCDADLAVSGFKIGAFTYLVVLLGRILNRREALLCLYVGGK